MDCVDTDSKGECGYLGDPDVRGSLEGELFQTQMGQFT